MIKLQLESLITHKNISKHIQIRWPTFVSQIVIRNRTLKEMYKFLRISMFLNLPFLLIPNIWSKRFYGSIKSVYILMTCTVVSGRKKRND